MMLGRAGSVVWVAVALSWCNMGCSSKDEKAAPEEATPTPSGCGADAPVCIEKPTDGFVLESEGTTIGPGQDVQYCEVLSVPGEAGEPVFISGIDGKMTRFSHHLNVMAVVPGSEADANTTVGDRVECVGNGRTPYGAGLHQIFGAVSPEQKLELPPGVGHRLEGGQKLVFNYHYFNTTEEPVPAKAALAFHTTDAANVTRELRRFGMYNANFSIPAGGTAKFTSECKMQEDVEILSLLRHTHKWGRDFAVYRAGGDADGEHVFTSMDYENDILYLPKETFIVKKGEGFRFECSFENTTNKTINYGELATDEMCILYGNLVATVDGPAKPEDCAILTAQSNGPVANGFPCAQCPDGD